MKKLPEKTAAIVHVESNIEDWAIFSLSKETRTERTYERGGEAVTITANKRANIIRAFDRRLFYGLVKLWQDSGRRPDGQINFTIYELLKILELPDSGRNYELVKDSVRRLKTNEIVWTKSFKTKTDKVNEEFGLNLITDYYFASREDKRGQLAFEFNTITLHPRLLKNLLEFYTRQLDIAFAVSLPDVAMFLYCLLDKRTGGRKGERFVIGLETLAAQNLNIRSTTRKDIKKILDRAHEILIETGYLKSAKYITGKDGSEQVAYIIRGERRRLLPKPDQGEAPALISTAEGIAKLRDKLK